MGKLLEVVTPEALGIWILIAVYVGWGVYKEWPELKKRISAGALKDKEMQEADKSLDGEIRALKDEARDHGIRIMSIEEKLANDFARINSIERELDRIRKMAENSLEERQLLMESNLALLKAVRELGANGPTGVKKAEEKLQKYLNSKAHGIE